MMNSHTCQVNLNAQGRLVQQASIKMITMQLTDIVARENLIVAMGNLQNVDMLMTIIVIVLTAQMNQERRRVHIEGLVLSVGMGKILRGCLQMMVYVIVVMEKTSKQVFVCYVLIRNILNSDTVYI
eukprot:TRINITY_DN3243_c2_g1_i3.p2 TRINITY_DN3243_c2_g1~~TRINITY_DN3243_c2_g1_i3.p2  ORF type:complete len:126 (-),score=8.16 TRINITY_DN3243_c2_g1_i3:56-433(-)